MMNLKTTLFFVLTLSFTGFAQDSETMEDRLNRFIAEGSDPLTAGLGFFAGRTELIRSRIHGDPALVSETENSIPAGVRATARAWADTQDSLALIVMHKGQLVQEHYRRDAGRDTRFNPQSMTKTVLALLVGRAIADGHIDSVDDPISKYLPELTEDPKGGIPLKALLQMAGGVEQLTTSYDVTPDNPGVVQFFGDDFKTPTMGLGVAREPFAKFDYNNDETNLAGHVLTAATGKRFTEYLSEVLWHPLGLSTSQMYQDHPGGSVMMSCCLLSRPMDFAKLGQMFLNTGGHNGQQLIPASWIAEMIQPSSASPGYGYQIWLGSFTTSPVRPEGLPINVPWQSEPFAAKDVATFRGFGFQRVWVIPSCDLVIMRAGQSWPSEWDESVLPNLFTRAVECAAS